MGPSVFLSRLVQVLLPERKFKLHLRPPGAAQTRKVSRLIESCWGFFCIFCFFGHTGCAGDLRFIWRWTNICATLSPDPSCQFFTRIKLADAYFGQFQGLLICPIPITRLVGKRLYFDQWHYQANSGCSHSTVASSLKGWVVPWVFLWCQVCSFEHFLDLFPSRFLIWT